jgi:hypothetical protein
MAESRRGERTRQPAFKAAAATTPTSGRSHRATGHPRGRPPSVDLSLLKSQAIDLFTSGIVSGLPPLEARTQAYSFFRSPSGSGQQRSKRRWWARIACELEEPGVDEFVRVEGGAAGTASLQELDQLLNANAVEKILCPRGHGRYELSDCEGQQVIAGNFTAGSCSPTLVVRALELAQRHGSTSTPGFNFVDVGSGPGLPLAVAAVSGGCNRVTGIELFIKRHLAAVDLMRHLALMDLLRCAVQLLRGDFLEPNLILAASLREAHAVLVNNCTFTEPFNVAMCQGPLRLMPSGSVLVGQCSGSVLWVSALGQCSPAGGP